MTGNGAVRICVLRDRDGMAGVCFVEGGDAAAACDTDCSHNGYAIDQIYPTFLPAEDRDRSVEIRLGEGRSDDTDNRLN